jgi:hypothetical protein
MTEVAQVPFYMDWTFWAVVVSIAALVLSQLPPIHILLRRARLEVEAYSKIHLTHKVGNPNAQLHLIISNSGGREVRVKAVLLHFQRGDEDRFTLPAQNYLPAPDSKGNVLLTSFRLKPRDEWAHIVNFLQVFSRQEEKEYRAMESDIRNDIFSKREHVDENTIVEAEATHVQPFTAFFDRKFRWLPGEYELTLQIVTKPERAGLTKKYRVTIFESDSTELRDYTNDYKYGAGIFYEDARHVGIIVPLVEA